jgi:hypothetical protein
MKNLHFLIFIICSCSFEPSEVKRQIEISDAQFEMLEFPVVPPYMNYYFEGYKATTIDNIDYLVGLNFMRNQLDFINLTNPGDNFGIPVRREGPDQVKSYLTSIEFNGNEFVIVTRSNIYYGLLNIAEENYRIVHEFTFLPDYRNSAVSSNIRTFPASTITWSMDQEDIYIPIYPSIIVTDKSFVDGKSLVRINKRSGDFEIIDIGLPKLLRGEEGSTFPYSIQAYNYQNSERVFLSYPFTDTVYVYDKSKYRLVETWATSIKEFENLVVLQDIPYEKLYLGDPGQIDLFNKSGMFGPFKYNKQREVYYRLVKDRYPIEGLETNAYQISRSTAKWLVEYDLGGEILTVRKLPKTFDLTPVVVNGDYLFPLISGENDKEDIMQLARVEGYSK